MSATPVSTGSNPVYASSKNQRNLVLFSFVHSIFEQVKFGSMLKALILLE